MLNCFLGKITDKKKRWAKTDTDIECGNSDKGVMI